MTSDISMTYVAWDIETCPRPLEELSGTHRKRHEKESQRRMDGTGEPTEGDRLKAASLHPMLGWICCISAVAGSLENGHREPHSWTASSQSEEAGMLQSFWRDVQTMTDNTRNLRWVTFFGKQFDVPFLSSRSVRQNVHPASEGILNTQKHRSVPHLNSTNVWQPPWYSLTDLCDHLGVESPKGSFDGSDVAPAVRNGRIDDVRRYCERDVVATFRCVERSVPFLGDSCPCDRGILRRHR